tara:strand:+ start:15512 stop:15727 length:216 start_codon:yes stop_codon:yes gene_type:complete
MQLIIISSILLIFTSVDSFAYLGPGVGGGVIVATLGVIIAIFAAIFGILWFPIKRLIQKIKNKKNNKIKQY